MARKSGTSTAGIETSARYRRKQAAKRRAEEAEWAAKNGPVISYVDESVRSDDQPVTDELNPGTVDAGAGRSRSAT